MDVSHMVVAELLKKQTRPTLGPNSEHVVDEIVMLHVKGTVKVGSAYLRKESLSYQSLAALLIDKVSPQVLETVVKDYNEGKRPTLKALKASQQGILDQIHRTKRDCAPKVSVKGEIYVVSEVQNEKIA